VILHKAVFLHVTGEVTARSWCCLADRATGRCAPGGHADQDARENAHTDDSERVTGGAAGTVRGPFWLSWAFDAGKPACKSRELAMGIVWCAVDLRWSTEPVLFGIGFSLFYLGPVAVFTHLVLALPTGRLATWPERLAALGVDSPDAHGIAHASLALHARYRICS
jgi:hypothetical protein